MIVDVPERVADWTEQQDRWEAFRAANPDAELRQDDDGTYGMTVRGRVGPGMPWTDPCWSMERLLGALEAMTAERPGIAYDWDAGTRSGVSRSLAGAWRDAGEHLCAGRDGSVREARTGLEPAGAAGKVPVHRRTGRLWRGRLAGGSPCWRQVA